jgi:microcystin-dependent protein
MPSPKVPADFQALVPTSGGSLCTMFVNALLKFPLAFYGFINWLLDSDGNFSTEVIATVTAYTQRPGDLIFSGRPSDTDGRLLCNGAAVSRTTYADLFAAIGTTFGEGDASTTFNVPDYQDRFPIGSSGTKLTGSDGGESTVALIESDLPRHRHYYGIGGTPHDTIAENSGVIDTDGAGIRYTAGTLTTKAGQTLDFGANTPATADDQTDVDIPLPPWLACYVYIRT